MLLKGATSCRISNLLGFLHFDSLTAQRLVSDSFPLACEKFQPEVLDLDRIVNQAKLVTELWDVDLDVVVFFERFLPRELIDQ